MWVLAGLRPAALVVLVTISVVRDTPLDRHFSAWSRPKPAPDRPLGPSVASGVIPTKGGRNGVLRPPPGRAPQGRWRSSPWKRCNHAPPRSRVREHPAPLGALRLHTDLQVVQGQRVVREYPAPLGALRHIIEGDDILTLSRVREHPAPLGALRPPPSRRSIGRDCQGAPRTAIARIGQGLVVGLCCPRYRSCCVPDPLPRARCLVFLWVSRIRVGAARGPGPPTSGCWSGEACTGVTGHPFKVGGGLFCCLVWCLGGAVAIIPVPRTASVTASGPAGYGPYAPRHLAPGPVLRWGWVGCARSWRWWADGQFCRNLRIRAGSTPFLLLCAQCPRRSGVRAPRRPEVALVLILRMRHTHGTRTTDRRQPIRHTA